jgi:hypothetical protein
LSLIQQNPTAYSTLGDLIDQVRRAFDAIGNPVAVMVGKQYLENGEGSGFRVVFVPEKRGRIGNPIYMGDCASMTHGCEVHVRAPETGDDIQRFRNACTLAHQTISLIQTAGTGRIEWGELEDGSPLDVDSVGAELVFGFLYTQPIFHDPLRFALPSATIDTSLPVPQPPPGVFASGGTVTVTVQGAIDPALPEEP